MNAFAHTVFAAWHSILSRGPKWIVRAYLLLVAGFSKRFFSGLLATRCRNVVLEAEWPKVGLPAQAVRFGDRKSTRLNSSHRNTSRMPSSA